MNSSKPTNHNNHNVAKTSFLQHLKNNQDKKLLKATHHISAWVIKGGDDGEKKGEERGEERGEKKGEERGEKRGGREEEGFDDDGEGGAGEKLLFLLKKRGFSNIVIVVVRWFGGIQLFGLRFKLITNTANKLFDTLSY